VGRQWLTLGLLTWSHLCRCLRFRHRCFSFQVFQLQFQLLDLLIQFFRPTAELHALQLRQYQLQMLDLGGARRQLCAQVRHLRFTGCQRRITRHQRRLMRQQHGFQRFDIVR
jgi:hypothetical protein